MESLYDDKGYTDIDDINREIDTINRDLRLILDVNLTITQLQFLFLRYEGDEYAKVDMEILKRIDTFLDSYLKILLK